jgi:hypothetical protein
MARRVKRDHRKEQFWRRLLRRWRRSGLTIRDFCFEHEVSEASFFAWRRIIAERDREAAWSKPSSGTQQSPHAKQEPSFVPVRVLPSLGVTSLEVVLGQGRVVRVPTGFDAATLRQLLALLEEGLSC